VEQLFTEIDELSETADDERTQDILGALYDWAEA
jgi:exodeoxyribonuclease-1